MSLEDYVLYKLAMNELELFDFEYVIHIGQCTLFNELEDRVYSKFNLTKEDVLQQNIYPVVRLVPSTYVCRNGRIHYKMTHCRVIDFQPLFTNYKNIVRIDLESNEPVKLIPLSQIHDYISKRGR